MHECCKQLGVLCCTISCSLDVGGHCFNTLLMTFILFPLQVDAYGLGATLYTMVMGCLRLSRQVIASQTGVRSVENGVLQGSLRLLLEENVKKRASVAGLLQRLRQSSAARRDMIDAL